MFAGTLGERARIVADRSKLLAQPIRLFEMEAEDFVEAATRVGKPIGEAFVQLASQLLGHRLVGGVANEQMPKAKRVVVGERRRSMWSDELFAHERRQRGDVRTECGERGDPELLADHGRTLGRNALSRRKLLEPRGEERLDGRRDADVAVASLL